MSSATEEYMQFDSDQQEMETLCRSVFQQNNSTKDNVCETFYASENLKFEFEGQESNTLEEIVFDGGTKWPSAAIELLLEQRKKLKESFNNNKYSKPKLWDRIVKLLNENNYLYTSIQVQEKYNAMVIVYRKYAERMVLKKKPPNWKWFTILDHIYNYRPTTEKPPDYLLGSTLDDPEDSILPESNSTQESKRTEKLSKWTKAGIKYFLQLRLHLSHLYLKPTPHKTKLWRVVSREMKEAGFNFTAKQCSSKWHNLEGTYFINKKRREKFGDKAEISWEWFDIIDKIQEEKTKSESLKIERSTFESPLDENDYYNDIDYLSEETQDENVPMKTSIEELREKNESETDVMNENSVEIMSDGEEVSTSLENKIDILIAQENERSLEHQECQKLEEKKLDIERKKLIAQERIATALENIFSHLSAKRYQNN